jgi:hypothetical protein
MYGVEGKEKLGQVRYGDMELIGGGCDVTPVLIYTYTLPCGGGTFGILRIFIQ